MNDLSRLSTLVIEVARDEVSQMCSFSNPFAPTGGNPGEYSTCGVHSSLSPWPAMDPLSNPKRKGYVSLFSLP